MPTLQQLPQAVSVTRADNVLIEQNAQTYVTSVDALLAGVQDKLTLASGALLGRMSVGPGAPEPIGVGTGLQLVDGKLVSSAAVFGALPSVLPAIDASAALNSANGGIVARSLAARAGEVANVLDYGADPTGTVDSAPAFRLAVGSGKPVWIPAGRYTWLNNILVPSTGLTMIGAGRGVVTIVFDETVPANPGITNANFNIPTVASRVHLRDFTIQGLRATSPSFGQPLVYFNTVTDVLIENVGATQGRRTGIGCYNCQDVVIRGCHVGPTNGDGIDAWDCPNVTIEGNHIFSAADDAIACHTNDLYAGELGPVRSGVLIANNIVQESNGIKVLGPKLVTITGNILKRMLGFGIVAFADGHAQGDTPNFGLRITNNTISDVFQRGDYADGSNREQYYIAVGGARKKAGTLLSPPGTPRAGSGIGTDLYGTGVGVWYSNNQAANANVASPGSPAIVVSGNTLLRTLPAVTSYDQWGYGQLQVGTGGAWNGAVTEAMLGTSGIILMPGLRNTLISDNLIAIRGAAFGIGMPQGAPGGGGYQINDLDYDGVTIARNMITGFRDGGFFYPDNNANTNQRIKLLDNEFDADPDFIHSVRGANGTWLSPNTPQGIYAPGLTGLIVARNHFRNLARPITPNASYLALDNILHADPAPSGSGLGNKGIGELLPAGREWSYLIEVCDSADPQYGKLKSVPVFSSASQPTTGTYVVGHFTANAAPTPGSPTLLGWKRMSTGTGHVAGIDWAAIYSTDGAVTFLSPLVSSTYVASGAISPLDNVALVNASAAVSMTLAAGTRDGHQIIIKRFGNGSVALNARVDGSTTNIAMNSGTAREAVALAWCQSLNTWLMI